MRSASGVAGVIADPACTVQNGGRQRYDKCEYVEVAELGNIIGIKEALLWHTVDKNRHDVNVPAEFQQNESDENHK